MQKVAAYLMERQDGMNWSESRVSEAAGLQVKVIDWLRSNGAPDVGPRGSYHAEDGSHATYSLEEAADEGRTWWMARLQEVTAEGRRFAAAISVTNGSDRVSVYVTLEAGSEATSINPVEVDPKCPRIVRGLLDLPGPWYHGSSQLYHLRRVEGFDQGEGLAAELRHPDRTVPIIVITEVDSAVALPELHDRLAYDLAGLANVVVLDSDATWALTDHLGVAFSCYWGAVRLYWPRLRIDEDPYRHPLWTAQRLRGATSDFNETRQRLRRQLRRQLMRASALSVVRPHEIDDIRSGASHRALAELKARAT